MSSLAKNHDHTVWQSIYPGNLNLDLMNWVDVVESKTEMKIDETTGRNLNIGRPPVKKIEESIHHPLLLEAMVELGVISTVTGLLVIMANWVH